MRIEIKFIDKKSLSISDLQIDYLNLDNSVRNNKRENISQSNCSNFEGSHPTEKCFKKRQKEKGYKQPPFNPRNSNNKCNEHSGWKPNMCFRC